MKFSKCGCDPFLNGYECADCGNHVCGKCAEANRGLCPFCYGRLYRCKN